MDGDIKTVHTSRGDLKTFGILIATGASPRKLGFEGEAEYAGRGGLLRHLRRRVLHRQGSTGGRRRIRRSRESVFLTKYASKVTVLVREPDFTCDAAVAAEAKNNPKIDVRYKVELKGVTAGQGGQERSLDPEPCHRPDRNVEARRRRHLRRLRVRRPVPATDLVRGVVELDDHGYVVTHDLPREPRCRACTRPAICASRTCARWSPPPPTVRLPPWNWSVTPSR